MWYYVLLRSSLLVPYLLCMQDQASNVDVLLTDANGIFHSIKVRTYCVFYEIRFNRVAFSWLLFCNFNLNCLVHVWFNVLQSWQALSQSDGRWRYSSNNPESSIHAAGNISHENMLIFRAHLFISIILFMKNSLLCLRNDHFWGFFNVQMWNLIIKKSYLE
jgi:hypothetical protein